MRMHRFCMSLNDRWWGERWDTRGLVSLLSKTWSEHIRAGNRFFSASISQGPSHIQSAVVVEAQRWGAAFVGLNHLKSKVITQRRTMKLEPAAPGLGLAEGDAGLDFDESFFNARGGYQAAGVLHCCRSVHIWSSESKSWFSFHLRKERVFCLVHDLLEEKLWLILT